MLVIAMVLGGTAGACSLLLDSADFTGAGQSDAAAAAPDVVTIDALVEAEADAPQQDRYFGEVMSDGPIAYFRLSDTTPSCKNEVSGSSITALYPTGGATQNVPGALSGVSDGALRFDSLSARLAVYGDLDFPGDQPFTIEAWVKLADFSGVDIASDMTFSGSVRTGWVLFLEGASRFRSEMWKDNVHLLYAVHDTPVTTSSFHHVVLFHSNVDQLDHLVIDGRFAAGGSTDRGPGLRIVNGSLQTWGGFRGTLDELAIYDKALPLERIVAHYDAR